PSRSCRRAKACRRPSPGPPWAIPAPGRREPDASSGQSLRPIIRATIIVPPYLTGNLLPIRSIASERGALADSGRTASRSAFHGFTRFGVYTTGRNVNIAATATWPMAFLDCGCDCLKKRPHRRQDRGHERRKRGKAFAGHAGKVARPEGAAVWIAAGRFGRHALG